MLKAINIYLLPASEFEENVCNAVVISVTHFTLYSLLGFVIAFIIVKHSKNPRMAAEMTFLSIISFLTHIASLNAVNLYN
ncbi:MAG: hypothetical protein MK240_08915 [Opitutales bacterium]|nr:hypothetical protein [Opitutales bacterium]